MEQAAGAEFAPLRDDAHLLRPVLDLVDRTPDRVLAAYRSGDRLVELTVADVYERMRALSKGLIAKGVAPGDRVALMSHTRLEWMLVDYAILAAGAVTVPVYETSSAEQLQWILEDSGAVLAVLETPAMRAQYKTSTREGARDPHVFVIDEGGLDELAAAGRDVTDAELDARIAEIGTGDLATIVYTSGTTGRPKGCTITHGNLRSNVLQNIDAVRSMLHDDETSILFLPLAHTLGKIVLLIGMERGYKAVFATGMDRLQEELPMARSTMIVAVPRVFEKVFNSARQLADQEGHGKLFDKAAQVAAEWSRRRAQGRFSPLVAFQHALFDRLVYRRIRAVFGGTLRFAFSGGAPLGERLTHFFDGIGIRVFEGYGLTETSPTLTNNRADAWRPGTVGRPLAGTTIRIAGDGEVLAKGPQVFGGYWRNPEATAETFDSEGWFRTGDLGHLDEDGFLRITGRKKEILVTAAGKNVAPAPLEDRMRAHALISQAIVIGEKRPFVSALVTLDEEAVAQWASARGREVPADPHGDPELVALIQRAVDDANELVSRAESIRMFVILSKDLTVEAGELTPTLKVRRASVENGYAELIDDLYAGRTG